MKKRLLSSSPRLFTVEAANNALPLVSAIAADLVPLWRSVNSTRKRIQHLIDGRDVVEGNPYSDELSAIEDRLARDSKKVEGYIDELREIGVEFKGANSQPHACFPAMLDGRLVYLSWQIGESEVSHWMDLGGEFDDRQSLLAAHSTD
jgi:hypothetical protein